MADNKLPSAVQDKRRVYRESVESTTVVVAFVIIYVGSVHKPHAARSGIVAREEPVAGIVGDGAVHSVECLV